MLKRKRSVGESKNIKNPSCPELSAERFPIFRWTSPGFLFIGKIFLGQDNKARSQTMKEYLLTCLR